jgi:hypothetical protein
MATAIGRVKNVFTNLAPPVPDDDFEAIRADALRAFSKLQDYVATRETQEAGE